MLKYCVFVMALMVSASELPSFACGGVTSVTCDHAGPRQLCVGKTVLVEPRTGWVNNDAYQNCRYVVTGILKDSTDKSDPTYTYKVSPMAGEICSESVNIDDRSKIKMSVASCGKHRVGQSWVINDDGSNTCHSVILKMYEDCIAYVLLTPTSKDDSSWCSKGTHAYPQDQSMQ